MLASSNGTTTTFVYDGDGNRVRKTVGDGDEIDTLYVNKYYEENVAGGANVTVSYYLGDRMIAQKNNDNLMYVHQDHLSGTSLMTDEDGDLVGSVMKYYPFGDRLESEANLPTDRLFTGQRYDDTGLYYYGARYYDPEIGRFISPDTIVPDPISSQGYNRYSYCLNNPLKYNDPSGHIVASISDPDIKAAWDLFAATCPDIAEEMEKNQDITYNFGWKDLNGEGGYTDPDSATHEVQVYLNQNLDKTNATEIAWVIAHESVHCMSYIIYGIDAQNTQYEEAVAFQVQYWFGKQTYYNWEHGEDARGLDRLVRRIQQHVNLNLPTVQGGKLENKLVDALTRTNTQKVNEIYGRLDTFPNIPTEATKLRDRFSNYMDPRGNWFQSFVAYLYRGYLGRW